MLIESQARDSGRGSGEQGGDGRVDEAGKGVNGVSRATKTRREGESDVPSAANSLLPL